ncbi:MAG: shikimate dehydrogenase, partial [Rhodospirillales bacterium]
NAKRIGAVNTVIVHDDGSLEGRNTDNFGFMENLKANAPSWKPEHGPALILGAGGAARAVCAALIDAGAPELRLVNRTQARAEDLAGHAGGAIKVFPWPERNDVLDGVSLLVNTTTLGMAGKPPLDLVLDRLPQEAVVNDIVYTPLQTPLLKAAADSGNPVVDGLGMLLHQGRPGFAAWFGVDPEVTTELRDFMEQGLES